MSEKETERLSLNHKLLRKISNIKLLLSVPEAVESYGRTCVARHTAQPLTHKAEVARLRADGGPPRVQVLLGVVGVGGNVAAVSSKLECVFCSTHKQVSSTASSTGTELHVLIIQEQIFIKISLV